MAFMKTRQTYRCTITGKVSVNYIDVLPEELTLDPAYTCIPFYNHHRTLFREVTILPWERFITPEMKELFALKIASHPDKGPLFARMRIRLEQVIMENWKRHSVHAFLHSSGRDSRLLSWLIKRLHRKHGDRWLGQVAFLCGNNECPYMREIMRYEGWKENHHFFIINSKANPLEYYKDYFLDFKNAWKWINGVQAKPQNLLWYLPEVAQRQGILPDDYHTWTSQWGNEVFDACSGQGGRELEQSFKKMYLSHMCSRPKPGREVIEPFTDILLARTIAHSQTRLGTNLRLQFLNSVDSRLAQFKRTDMHGDLRTIAGSTLKQMLQKYRESWYGRKVRAISGLPQTTQFHPHWSYWTAASLCEYLLEHNYKIKVGG